MCSMSVLLRLLLRDSEKVPSSRLLGRSSGENLGGGGARSKPVDRGYYLLQSAISLVADQCSRYGGFPANSPEAISRNMSTLRPPPKHLSLPIWRACVWASAPVAVRRALATPAPRTSLAPRRSVPQSREELPSHVFQRSPHPPRRICRGFSGRSLGGPTL